jgi:hypothetical protein
MAYIDTIKLVTGDTLPDLRFELKDSASSPDGVTYDENNSDTWAPLDLTDSTVRLRIREVGGEDVISTIVGVLASPENGVVVFPFTQDSFAASGLYEGEVEITYVDGGIQTMYDLVKFKVRSDFD